MNFDKNISDNFKIAFYKGGCILKWFTEENNQMAINVYENGKDTNRNRKKI